MPLTHASPQRPSIVERTALVDSMHRAESLKRSNQAMRDRITEVCSCGCCPFSAFVCPPLPSSSDRCLRTCPPPCSFSHPPHHLLSSPFLSPSTLFSLPFFPLPFFPLPPSFHPLLSTPFSFCPACACSCETHCVRSSSSQRQLTKKKCTR